MFTPRCTGRDSKPAAQPYSLLFFLVLTPTLFGADPIPTTAEDFVLPGTQPNTLPQEIRLENQCSLCHNVEAIGRAWQGSIKAHGGRDPLFTAALAIADQQAPGSGEYCIRCHMPRGWLAGRGTPSDGSAITAGDRESVNCAFCHQQVDPIYEHGVSPAIDESVLNALGDFEPDQVHNGSYVIDPDPSHLRGPFNNADSPHSWYFSPFHQSTDICANCHDSGNPLLSRDVDDTYQLNAYNTTAPSYEKSEQFPLDRTWSEWSQSAFAQGPIDMGGRFGGNKTMVSTCQDCHMPDTSGRASNWYAFGIYRDDLPQHHFNGSSTWQLDAIANLFPEEVDVFRIEDAKQRNLDMIRNAASLEVSQSGEWLKVRVINETGHKLPTGFPDGRRMWINVVYKENTGLVIDERGNYNFGTGDLDAASTSVYEAVLGMDEGMAAATNLPPGPSYHFILNNTVIRDSRIPPRGFTNAGFASVQAAPVDYAYNDGVHWDDTYYSIPSSATTAEVTVYFQSTSKEYITFLRDANQTNSAGQTAYDEWLASGKSPPVDMSSDTLTLIDVHPLDFDADGDVDNGDLAMVQDCASGPYVPYGRSCFPADLDVDGDVDQQDFGKMQRCLSGPGMAPDFACLD